MGRGSSSDVSFTPNYLGSIVAIFIYLLVANQRSQLIVMVTIRKK